MLKEEIIKCDENYFMTVYSGRYPLVIDHGSGIRVYGQDGQEYLDFLAGIGVNALGYGHPVLVKALQEQVAKLIHCSNLYYIEPQAYLEKLLIKNSCCDRVFFANSGSEANEGALKLARKYFKTRGEKKFEVITAERSFHGRTLVTTAATGQEKYHKPYQPLPEGFTVVPFNDLTAMEKAIGPETAAVMIEPVQGEGGVYPAEQEYLQGLRELCNQKDILLIFDEVQCGVGRTGSLFAYEEYGVEPDIMTLAKALGGGVPIGALLAKEKVASAFEPGDHGTTFGGNPLASRAAVTTLEVILEDGFLEGVKEKSSYFVKQLEGLIAKTRNAKGIRGLGLMLALELSSSISAKDLTMELFSRGFLVNAVQEHTLRFLPPLIVEKADIDLLVGELADLLNNS
ncbi:aspartate aminotransferase family protein [Halocella sp. SP3-1]|uniref:aspartate aminotransferase family protein n=1 Tax=Halocella sp. SP3-1 TaxID=2382161 RepID=UPI000F75FB89|nr:aspartate aminotransferase family protein [Halocella sp. SP3-1]AZO95523.1 aspartate aminotransferase family protein [Halocella sp. SP3-1]